MSAQGACTEFGPFRFFPAERRLLRGEVAVPIGSRELDLLAVLIERAGEVVSKRELFARVWPDLIVEESSLRVHVAGLRKALDDGRDQARYIVNVPGRGYSFVASLSGTAGPASGPLAQAPSRQSTRIIGRDVDIDAVAELLSQQRFVTVHGPGGVGKTTLALAVAGAQSGAFADGVRVVDLSLNVGVHTVAAAVASTLELVARDSDLAARIVDHVRSREMLLVLDSCETRISDAAALAERVIQDAPGVSILATSREPLGTRSEHVYPLAPLSFPPEGALETTSALLGFAAARLFCERAVAAGYRAGFKDADADVIGEICRNVEGNALALELAASRVSTYGVRQTAALLNSHMKLTLRGRRTAPPRHQTLTAMLDWSYALIDERERDVLCQLSVFVGGFGLEEARGVAGNTDEVLGVLEQLVLKSLVTVDTGGQSPRYRLLDTTRAYAGAKLRESGTAGEALGRHARYYLDWLTRSTSCAAVPLEHASNIRAALEWALSEGGSPHIGAGLAIYACEMFLRLGMVAESRRWSERALESLAPERAGSLQDLALRAALGPATVAGYADALRGALGRARDLSEGFDDSRQQFRLLSALFVFHRRAGALDGLLPIAECATAIAPLVGGLEPVVAAQAMLGGAHHIMGNLAESRAILGAVCDARRGTDATTHFYGFHQDAEVLNARTLWLQGYPDQAARAAINANRTDERRDPISACLGLMWGVSVHHLRGDWEVAEEYVRRMLAIASAHSLLPYKWFALALRGDLQSRRGRTAAGISDLKEYSRRLADGGYDINACWLTCCLAEGLAGDGEFRQALELLNGFNADPSPRGDVNMPEFLRVRGAILAQAGESRAAEQEFQASLDMADAQGAMSWRLRTLSSRARLRLGEGRIGDDRELLAATCGRFTEGFETLDFRNARALLAEIDARSVAPASH